MGVFQKKKLHLTWSGDMELAEYMLALRSSSLPGPARAIAFWIATRCADGWRVTYDDVARDSGFSRATVVRSIRQLEDAAWLVKSRKFGHGNQYELSIPDATLLEKPIGSERADASAQSEPVDDFDRLRVSRSKAHSDPVIGSERSYPSAQSEPIYTKTKQKHIKTNKNVARVANDVRATSSGLSDISYSSLNRSFLVQWVSLLLKVPDARAAIESYCKEIAQPVQTFPNHLYADERAFNIVKPWLQELRLEGRI